MASKINNLYEQLKHKHPNYFEGTLQLRDVSKEIIDWVFNTIESDARALITKEKRVRGGVDLYLTSQKYLQILGKKLKERFGGDLKLSSSLHTRSRTGHDLYRVTVLFRPSFYKRGDRFVVNDETFEILRVDKYVEVKSSNSGKKLHMKRDFVERFF